MLDHNSRGLCTENGSEWIYPAHRPCTCKRVDLSATALFQQSQSGCRTRTYLRRVPGGNRRIEAVLCKAVGRGGKGAAGAF